MSMSPDTISFQSSFQTFLYKVSVTFGTMPTVFLWDHPWKEPCLLQLGNPGPDGHFLGLDVAIVCQRQQVRWLHARHIHRSCTGVVLGGPHDVHCGRSQQALNRLVLFQEPLSFFGRHAPARSQAFVESAEDLTSCQTLYRSCILCKESCCREQSELRGSLMQCCKSPE